MLIRIANFKGLAPSINPASLPEQAAQIAKNCHLNRGDISPLGGTTFVAAPTKAGTILSIFPFATKWFNWISDVDICKAPLADDQWERVYFAGGDTFPPQYTVPAYATAGADYPTASYKLGIPAPADAPTIAVVGTPTSEDPTLVETRAYVYTFVSAYGEEGPPSPVSILLDVAPGQSVALSGLLTTAGTGYNLSKKRIYRTNTGSSGTEYQLVNSDDALMMATTIYSDTVASASLGSVLASATWDPQPATLHSLIALPCGSLAGLYKNQLCFSEPYQPHAWPMEYRISFDADAVAIGAYGNNIVVTTKGLPYVVSGSHPSSMGYERLEEGSSCVSKRGMVDMGYAAIWPTQNGLMFAGMGAVRLLTQGLITQKDWAAYLPATIHAYLWDKKYVAFWSNSSGHSGFIFDPETGDLTFHDIAATAGYHDPLTGTLYLVVGGQIVTWDSSAALTYTWKSKKFVLPTPANFSCAQVVAGSYPLIAKFYADGVLRHTQSVSSATPFRLPGGFRPESYEVEISGTPKVTMVALATSMQELASV